MPVRAPLHRIRLIGATSFIFISAALPQWAGAAFTPPDSADLQVWLDAGSGVTSDINGNVSAWADQSGKGHNAAQGTSASQPVVTNGGAAFNNNPVISFDGSNDYMQSALPLNSASGLTIFVVAQHQSTSAGRVLVGASSGDYGASSKWLIAESSPPPASTIGNNVVMNYDSNGHHADITNGPFDTNEHIYAITFNGNAQTLTQAVDGDVSSGTANFTNFTTTTLDIGAYKHFLNAYDFGDVKIAEILAYSSALSSTDAAAVNSYLEDKYQATPEPGCIGLASIALGVTTLRRRRKTREGR